MIECHIHKSILIEICLDSDRDCIIRSQKWDGKERTLFKMFCSLCKTVYYIPKSQISKTKYCSNFCRYSSKRIDKIRVNCAHCNNELLRDNSKLKQSRSGLFFCNRRCKENAQKLGGIKLIQPSHYGTGTGKYNYRERALNFYTNRCNHCNYSRYIEMLEVHHIDSNRNNNVIENLEILCVWCHALETKRIKPHNLPGDMV